MSNESTDIYLKRGDTFAARNFATVEQPAGTPLPITAARMQVRSKNKGTLLLEWISSGDTPSITITGAGNNVVTLGAKAPEITAALPPGDHEYDLEVTLQASGQVLTILEGKFAVSADITRTTT